jgi:Uma2 family endonuclease
VTVALVEPDNYLTLAEYLAVERDVEVRHEYVGGRAYAMTGGSINHGLVVTALAAALDPASRAQGCRLFTGNVKLQIGDAAVYYPDVMVVSAPRGADPYVETSPCLVVEVLSPSTRAVDLREKRAAFSMIPSVEAYVIIEAERPDVEVYRRDRSTGRWVSEHHSLGESFRLDCPDVVVDVDLLYRDHGF